MEAEPELESDDDEDEREGDDQLQAERDLVTVDVTRLYTAPIIANVRKMVKLFKKSPLKNEILQKYVVEDFRKPLELILDCKTRWSSLFEMLRRFLELKNCILKAATDVHIEVSLDEMEFKHISEVLAALEPLKLTVEALCRRDATLLTADAALSFAHKELSDQKTEIAFDLALALERRLKERRTEVSSIMQYLHSGKCQLRSEYDDISPNVSKNKICTTIKDLVSRLHPDTGQESEESDHDLQLEDNLPSCSKKQKSNLELALNKAIKEVDLTAHTEKEQVGKTLISTIKKEMGLFEAGGSRGHHLQLIYKIGRASCRERV